MSGRDRGCGLWSSGRGGGLEATRTYASFRRYEGPLKLLFFLFSREGNGSELSVRRVNVAAIVKINWNIEMRGTGTKKLVADGHHGAGNDPTWACVVLRGGRRQGLRMRCGGRANGAGN